MNKSEYFKILGLNNNASMDDIKQAYRRLAMKYHPDRNPNDPNSEEKFKEIKKAYEILTNKKTINKDNTSDEYNFNDFTNFNETDSSFEDIFSDFFTDFSFKKKRKKENNSNRGDTLIKIEITINEAANGCKYKLFIPFWLICNKCNGDKYIKQSEFGICNYCLGTGYIKIMDSFLNIKQLCPYCSGYGRISKKKCMLCNGLGKIKKREQITILIPKGTFNGYKIKVDNKGDLYDIKRQLYGNLYLEVYIKKSNEYSLDKNMNVHHNIMVSYLDILLGVDINIVGLYGKKIIKIKSCYDINNPIRVNSFGYYLISSKIFTDMIIHIQVFFPKKLSKKQYELVLKLKSLS